MKMNISAITDQILQESAKTVLRGKILALNNYTRKEKKSQINNISFYLKNLGKEEQNKAKLSRRNKIIKIRAKSMNLKQKNNREN